jgi:hypothetical protein
MTAIIDVFGHMFPGPSMSTAFTGGESEAPGRRGSACNLFCPGALMSFYPVPLPDATLNGAEDAAMGLLGRAGVVAVRAADLASSARQGLGRDGRAALTAAGAGRIRSGDVVVWLKPVAVARAVVRRDGRVQAAGHPADHARWAWPKSGWTSCAAFRA